MGFVVVEYEKIIDMILDSTLQLTFNKLPMDQLYSEKDSN